MQNHGVDSRNFRDDSKISSGRELGVGDPAIYEITRKMDATEEWLECLLCPSFSVEYCTVDQSESISFSKWNCFEHWV